MKIGNRKSHWSDFHVVWTANHWTCLSQYRGVKYLAHKKGNSILVRVAKLLSLSIYGSSAIKMDFISGWAPYTSYSNLMSIML